MDLPRTGLSEGAVLAALDVFKAQDLDWRLGRTWAYVYPAGDDVERVGKRAYTAYLTENCLDPTVFPSTMALENQVVAMVARHVGGDDAVAGNFTSGGTESILMACKTARDRAKALDPTLERPQIVMPETAHASFQKACAYFGLEPVIVSVDPTTFRATGEAVAAAITERTVLVVASAPSYAHGVIDDVEGIAAAAKAAGVLCHVDACVGGWMLPFWRELGAEVPPFDFSVDGVTSMSIDLHKYAFCPKGASVVLYRDAALREHQIFSCSNWTGYTIINATFQSTKTAGPLAAAWSVLHYLGREGYLERARAMKRSTDAILAGLARIDGLEVMGSPDFCLVAFTSEALDVFHVADEMRQRGWYVQPQLGYGDHRANVHLSVTPGVAPRTEAMLRDLEASVAAARAMPSGDLARQAAAVVRTMDADRLTDEAFDKLMSLAGIDGIDLPDRMAGINEILDSLPVALNERLLKRFFGGLNHLSDEQRSLFEAVRRGAGADLGSEDAPERPSLSGLGLRRGARRAFARSLRTAGRAAVGLAALANEGATRLE